MADPRSFTVKQCEPAYLPKSGGSISEATITRRNFFNSIGKIGDLEVLNDIGGGSVGRGLRNLASISNSIRVGQGALPSVIGSTVDAGANWVLAQTGLAVPVIETLRNFQPGMVNQAYGQAKVIYDQVKAGRFKLKDIPYVLQDLQNLERLGRNIFVPGRGDVQTTLGERCEASPYAVDMAARYPKYKFLFLVEFIADGRYGEMGTQYMGPLDMAFVIKKSSRPNIKYVTEDVNYYNYRTKVVTKAEFEEMQMSFHDDSSNTAALFYNAYVRAMSPITGMYGPEMQPDQLENSGMNFVGKTLTATDVAQQMGGLPSSSYASTTGTLVGDAKQVFSEIRLYHLFDNGHRMNVWRFFNPKITQLSLDEVDMSIGSDGNELSLNFSYDSVYLDPDVYLKDDTKYRIADLQRGAVYNLRYNGPESQQTSSQTAFVPAGISGISDLGVVNGVRDTIAGITAPLKNVISPPATDDLAKMFSYPFGGLG